MDQQEFSLGNSIIHRLDPRLKTLAAAGFSMAAALLTRPAALLAAACAAAALALLARLPARPLARRLALVNAFLLFLWLTVPLSLAADAPLRIGPVGIQPQGLLLALVITIKSNAIVLAGIALLATHPPAETARALSRLRVPGKLVGILLFMLRYLSEAQREYGWMRAAMSMRGFRPRTGLHTLKAYGNLVGMLLVQSYEKAEAVHSAMLCRGFDGRFHVLSERCFTRNDLVFFAVMAVLISTIALLNWA